ncbi:hypothetical protein [Sphingomonas sp. SUN039]|uniref:hypothetical protein n=1 Tax=Sphingomonas sp. SUN039 TaxID=2937787 RepID=UPI0021646C48|nr:hypothetical protein [Sphingomonas sp. SUN039]UVO52791.1 hypothetical protein M0209_01105 [Sphingomonas sp. SUN039]
MRLPLALIGLTATTAAIAQTPPPRPMLSDACRAEVEKLCPVAADGDRRARMQCVMTSQDKLSEGCKKELADLRAARERMRGDMRAEREKWRAGSTGDDAPPPPPPPQ